MPDITNDPKNVVAKVFTSYFTNKKIRMIPQAADGIVFHVIVRHYQIQ